MKNNHFTQSLLLALGEIIYVFLVALLMQNASQIFGDASQIFAGATFLLLFVVSTAISGILIFGKPILLYLDGEKKDALKMLSYILSWLLLFLLVFLLILMLVF